MEVLGEWKVLADMLLDDAACEARGEAATTNLVLTLSAAVRAATAGAGTAASTAGAVGTAADGRKPAAGKAKAAAKAAADARQDMTLALGQALPTLLRKFQSDAVKARGPLGRTAL